MKHQHGDSIAHALFRYLYFNRHRIVHKSELIAYLWPPEKRRSTRNELQVFDR